MSKQLQCTQLCVDSYYTSTVVVGHTHICTLGLCLCIVLGVMLQNFTHYAVMLQYLSYLLFILHLVYAHHSINGFVLK